MQNMLLDFAMQAADYAALLSLDAMKAQKMLEEEEKMKEVKSPKKPLVYYYGIVLLVLLVFNLIVSPLLLQTQVTETDYGTFMKMIEDQQIGEVQVEDNQILFTDKDEQKVYKTGVMDDPNLTERLYKSGAKFSKDIDQTTSPLMNFLITVVLPLVIFIGLGQYMSKKLLEQAGGKNSMMFGMGKSNAKVYVQVFGWHPFQ